MPVELFVDAGGSNTRVLIRAPSRVETVARFRSANPASAENSDVFGEVVEYIANQVGPNAISGLIASAAVSRTTLERETRRWCHTLAAHGMVADLQLLNDGLPLVLQPGSIPQIGVVLGTGSCFLLNVGGHVRRFGGTEWLSSDEAGASHLGLLALRSLARAHDGRARRTSLHVDIEAHFKADAEQLLREVAEMAHPKTAVAAIGQLVVESAFGQGDASAIEIVDRARKDLAEYLAAVLDSRGRAVDTRWRITGGLLANPGFCATVIREIRTAEPSAQIQVVPDMLALLPTVNLEQLKNPTLTLVSSGKSSVRGVCE